MATLNKVILLGNLTRNPELRYTQGGTAVCEFGIAMNRTTERNGEKREEVCYVDVEVWGKTGEACSNHLEKGRSVLIEGRLKYETWTERDTQKKRSKISVIAESATFMPRAAVSESAENGRA